MDKKTVLKMLGTLMVTSKRSDGEEYIHFNSECMNDTSEAYPVYRAVRDAMHDSGLTHDFSYEVAGRALDILEELEGWEDDDAIMEAVDNSTPIYTHDIMQIYNANSWAVDEAREEYGSHDSTKDAQMAWYSQIRNMVEAIKSNLADVIEEEA